LTKNEKAEKSRLKAFLKVFGPSDIFGYLMILPTILVLLFFFLYPLIFEIYTSFTNKTLSNDPKFVGFQNYILLLQNPEFITAVKNSIVYVSVVQIGKFTLGLGVAILLNQKLRARGLWRGLVLVPYAIPGFVAFLIWRLLYHTEVGALNIILQGIGLIDSPISFLGERDWAMPAVIVSTIWRGFPFWAIMFLAALQAVPAELYEAAAVDGANAWHRFRNISLPGIRPVILIVFMLSTINTINSFEAIWLQTGGGPSDATVILPIFAYRSLGNFQLGEASAAALSLVPISIVFSILILRKLRKD